MFFVETYLVPSRCLDDRTLELLVCFPRKSVKFISSYGFSPLSNASDMSKIERMKDRHPAGSVTWKPSTPQM